MCIRDRHYDPLHEVLITVGGSEAIDMCIRTIVQPGDAVSYTHLRRHCEAMTERFRKDTLMSMMNTCLLYTSGNA